MQARNCKHFPLAGVLCRAVGRPSVLALTPAYVGTFCFAARKEMGQPSGALHAGRCAPESAL